MDHPDITRALQTGSAKPVRNVSTNDLQALKDNKKELSISEFMKARFGK